jgi:hypothetical protein
MGEGVVIAILWTWNGNVEFKFKSEIKFELKFRI